MDKADEVFIAYEGEIECVLNVFKNEVARILKQAVEDLERSRETT